VGAVLVQNTNWRNAELAIENLRAAGVLTEAAISGMPIDGLQELIRPAGFFRQKAATLHRLASATIAAGGLEALLKLPTDEARLRLLSIKGVGFETADSILLYAGGHEVFVVDIYLRRWLERLGEPDVVRTGYDSLRQAIERLVRTRPEFLQIKDSPGKSPARHAPSRMSEMHRSPIARAFAELHAVIVADGVANKKPARERRS
jgi:endonuclease III related protein